MSPRVSLSTNDEYCPKGRQDPVSVEMHAKNDLPYMKKVTY